MARICISMICIHFIITTRSKIVFVTHKYNTHFKIVICQNALNKNLYPRPVCPGHTFFHVTAMISHYLLRIPSSSTCIFVQYNT